jgi:hypothetical protein
LSDAAATVDSRIVSLSKSRTDIGLSTDLAEKTFEKPASEAVAASDVRTRSFGKVLQDTAYATDDVNGASADDDQNIQFFKSLSHAAFSTDIISIVSSFSRVYSDAAYASEASVKLFGKSRVDQAVTSDSGFVKSQGYCDLDYFMEDYVGATRTF